MNQDNAVELDNAFFMWEDASISEMGAKAKAKMEAKNKEKNRQGTTWCFFLHLCNLLII